MELETAIKLLDHGWPAILSAAALVLVWTTVRPGGAKNRPLATLAVERVYKDLVRGIGVWWGYRREVLEARRDRDREITAAYASAQAGGRREADRLLPDVGAGDGGASDPSVDPGMEPRT